MTVLSTLIQARALIADPRHWTVQIRRTQILDGSFAYCALGALEASIRCDRVMIDSASYLYWRYNDYVEAYEALAKHIPQEDIEECKNLLSNCEGPESLVAFYNNLHSHQEVLALFDRAIKSQRQIDGLMAIEPVIEEIEYA